MPAGAFPVNDGPPSVEGLPCVCFSLSVVPARFLPERTPPSAVCRFLNRDVATNLNSTGVRSEVSNFTPARTRLGQCWQDRYSVAEEKEIMARRATESALPDCLAGLPESSGSYWASDRCRPFAFRSRRADVLVVPEHRYTRRIPHRAARPAPRQTCKHVDQPSRPCRTTSTSGNQLRGPLPPTTVPTAGPIFQKPAARGQAERRSCLSPTRRGASANLQRQHGRRLTAQAAVSPTTSRFLVDLALR